MKHWMKLACVALLLALGILPCQAGRFVDDSVKVDGHMRQLAMYLPDGVRPGAPLVFILHGYGAGIYIAVKHMNNGAIQASKVLKR